MTENIVEITPGNPPIVEVIASGLPGPRGPQGESRALIEENGAYPARPAPADEPVIFFGATNPDTLGVMLVGDTWVNTATSPDDAPQYALVTDIPTTPAEVGALPADTPIPSTPGDVGAEPAGLSTATNAALAATFARAINVKSAPYNAKGDGVTDDTAAIQSALDAVSLALGATTVVIPSGTYMIDGVNEAAVTFNDRRNAYRGGGIKPKAGTRLLLAPDAVLKVITNGSPGYSCVYLGQGQDDVTIVGGQVVGDRATHDYVTEPTYTTHEFGYGITVEGAKDVLIEGVKINNHTGDGIFLGSQGMLPYPPYVPAKRVSVRRCVIDSNRRNNISLVGTEAVWIEDNAIRNAGINDATSTGVAPKYGIDIEASWDSQVGYLQDNVEIFVRGNVFTGNVAGAFTNFNGNRVVFSGNRTDGAVNYGYGTENAFSNNLFFNLSNTTVPAISANSGAGRTINARVVISNNVVVGFASGFTLSNEGGVCVGNHISNTASGGGITVYKGNNITVADNVIRDCGGADPAGLSVLQSTNVNLSGNFVFNTRTGVRIQQSSTGVTAQSNRVKQGRQALYVEAGCEVMFKENAVDLPGHADGQTYDVQYSGTSKVSVIGNTFRNSTVYPVSATNATGGLSRIVGNQFLDIANPISCSGGRHEIVRNTFVGKRSTGSFSTGAILIASTDKSLILGNTVYHSDTVAYGPMVYVSTGATNTRIVGNTHIGTVILGGAPAGNEVTADNNLVAP